MKPLNYAILKYFTKVDEADVQEVYDALKSEYANHRMCKLNKVNEAIMTAEKNGLLEESRYELNANGDLVQYYKAIGDGKDAINNFIKD